MLVIWIIISEVIYEEGIQEPFEIIRSVRRTYFQIFLKYNIIGLCAIYGAETTKGIRYG